VVIVSAEVFLADEQVVIAVQLPELAVDDVEVLIREVVHDLVDVVLGLQTPDCLTSIPPPATHTHTHTHTRLTALCPALPR